MSKMLAKTLIVNYFLFSTLATPFPEPQLTKRSNLDVSLADYGKQQVDNSLLAIRAAISPEGAQKATVYASPSKENPNYYFHWVRDASVTMDLISNLYRESRDERFKYLVDDYSFFTRQLQATPTQAGFGEPKWNMDGTPFEGPVARPENDGPALRANSLINFANTLISFGRDFRFLYDGQFPSKSPVKADLEYISQNWNKQSYDCWGEVSGSHFYTLMAERKALVQGSSLAMRISDFGAANHYISEARKVESVIRSFWDEEKGYIVATKDRNAGRDDKLSNLDSQVILAVVESSIGDGFFSPDNDKIQATAYALIKAFEDLYPINKQSPDGVGVAIGRYPEDKYNGIDDKGKGNPWVITTAGFAELHYKIRISLFSQGSFTVTKFNQNLLNYIANGRATYEIGENVNRLNRKFFQTLDFLSEAGDSYLRAIQLYTSEDFTLSEQINSETGKAQSAPQLTRSHVSFINAWRTKQVADSRGSSSN